MKDEHAAAFFERPFRVQNRNAFFFRATDDGTLALAAEVDGACVCPPAGCCAHTPATVSTHSGHSLAIDVSNDADEPHDGGGLSPDEFGLLVSARGGIAKVEGDWPNAVAHFAKFATSLNPWLAVATAVTILRASATSASSPCASCRGRFPNLHNSLLRPRLAARVCTQEVWHHADSCRILYWF